MDNRKRNTRKRGGVPRPFGISNAGDQIVKRMTYAGTVLATGAGTAVPVTTLSSTACQGFASEFASFAARYQQYRVRAIRVTGKAIQPIQSATVAHSVLYRGDFIGSSTPGTAVQVLADEGVKLIGTDHDFRDVVTWRRNPNARLWNPTSAGIPVANTFSWVCASPATPPLTTAITYYAVVYEWEVELRGSQ